MTLAGTLVSGGFGYFGGENDRAAARYNEACKHAYDMLTDDKLNPYLTEQEARELALTQLLVAKKCTKDARL